MANHLANETSPYLLQHKDNPVDWRPWGPEALERARVEDKPMLVSIGYSACHWCHVMERESFENRAIAQEMNDRFINIKVDREERPDLDHLYMTAVTALTGQGGWPLNVFLTPDGAPFYGGTYFPPEDRMGLPGFPKVLAAVSEAYRNRRDEVEDSADRLRQFLGQANATTPRPEQLTPAILDQAAQQLAAGFDDRRGGFGGAPKFPQAAVFDFLLRYAHRTESAEAAGMVRQTLDAMAEGGIYDQIGGGFHRYTVDANWLTPHFEKMLYDNAQLASLYLDAWRAYDDPLHRRIATETLDYVAREMTAPEGGFYAAQDADSEGEEGAFYVWTPDELAAALDPTDAAIVAAYYGVTPAGNFEGKSILHLARSADDVAAEFDLTPQRVEEFVAAARPRLLATRNERPRPGLDDKVIVGWNGLMLKAFAEGARALARDDYRQIAVRNAEFLLGRARRDGKLCRTWKNGQAKLNGYLQDYAFVVDGLLSLYHATFERRWLDGALALTETMLAEFGDERGPAFFDTAASHEMLVARPRDLQDGAIPSGNAVAADVLLRLGALTENDDWTRRAARLLAAMVEPMTEQPLGCGRYLAALDFHLAEPLEIVIAGRPDDRAVDVLADVVAARYLPNALLALAEPDEPDAAERVPLLTARTMRDGKAAAYVCQHYACQAPVSEPDALAAQLDLARATLWHEF
ncbi:MAG TPA: thioredoxin domain-containing protein [Thermomicrobiales bacterium]|nr:thioredoxin domain-containing protein [Thermomicrobiales bacterium]